MNRMPAAEPLHDRAARLAQILLDATGAAEVWVSPDGRVGLKDAAWLAGVTHGHLRNRISEGKGPPTYGGGHGHLRTVRLFDLALWLESSRAD